MDNRNELTLNNITRDFCKYLDLTDGKLDECSTDLNFQNNLLNSICKRTP